MIMEKGNLIPIQNERLKIVLKNSFIYTGHIISFPDDNTIKFSDRDGEIIFIDINSISNVHIRKEVNNDRQ